jgi:hypothetical protein
MSGQRKVVCQDQNTGKWGAHTERGKRIVGFEKMGNGYCIT